MENECEFSVKGVYHPSSNLFSFEIYIDPNMPSDQFEFLTAIQESLEKIRTLQETETIIREFKAHESETIQKIGIILEQAADSTWAEYLCRSMDDESTQ